MAFLTESNLKKYIEQNPAIRAFYLVGNDTFMMDVSRRIIVAAYGVEEIVRFDVADFSHDAFEELFVNVPLMATKKAVLLDSFMPSRINAADMAFFTELLRDIPDYLIVVARALYEEDRFSVPKKCVDVFEGRAAVVELARKQGSELVSVIASLARRAGTGIDRAAIDELVMLCGNDLYLIKNEVEKNAAFCGYTQITAEGVRELSANAIETNVYDMVSAISQKKKKLALIKLRQMLAKRREPISICAVLIGSYVNIYRAFLSRQAGLNRTQYNELFGFSQNDIKAKIAFEQAAYYDEKRLAQIIKLLCKLDSDLKSSRADHAIELETAVAEILG